MPALQLTVAARGPGFGVQAHGADLPVVKQRDHPAESRHQTAQHSGQAGGLGQVVLDATFFSLAAKQVGFVDVGLGIAGDGALPRGLVAHANFGDFILGASLLHKRWRPI